MRFTSEQAYQAWRDHEPILVEHGAAAKICRDHGATIDDYLTEQENGANASHYDAWSILGWLGY